LQSTLLGGSNAYLTKINVSGSALVYSTFLGGSQFDDASGVAVDAIGNAYIAGSTDSTNFPAVGALQSTFGDEPEINASGSSLVYSTYLGGSAFDFGAGIALDLLRKCQRYRYD